MSKGKDRRQSAIRGEIAVAEAQIATLRDGKAKIRISDLGAWRRAPEMDCAALEMRNRVG